MNERGEIVGYSGANLDFPSAENKPRQALYWASPTSRPELLGTLPGGSASFARGINERGDIVGSADDANGNLIGFLIRSP
jgi:hypothetical protein